MKERNIVLILMIALAVTCAAEAQIITSVVRANGASGDRDPIGAYDGSTTPLATQAGGVKDGNYVFSDRTYTLINTPAGTIGSMGQPLIGSEYVRTFNSDKGNSGVTYTVTTSSMATLWITVDDRHANPQGLVDSAVSSFAAAGTFTDTGLHLFVGGDNNRQMSIYAADFPAGTYVFGYQASGNNFYTIGAVLADPSFNPPPVVDAGPDTAAYVGGDPLQLDGTITDADPQDGSYTGTVSSYWAQISGPGTATFDPADTTDVEDPTVTFDAAGTYELLLQATDGQKDANDVVTIIVQVPQLVGYWPFDGDALDHGDNAEKSDGTLVGQDPGGMPVYSEEAAVGTHSIDVTDTLGLNAIDYHDPNLPHVSLGAATELDFGFTNWTVCGWIKTTQSGTGDVNKGTIFGNGGDTGGGHRYCLILGESNPGRVRLVTDDDSTKVQARTSSSNLVNDDLWHFIVGLRDGDETRIYRDGIFDDDRDLPAGYDLSGTSQLGSNIGVIGDWNGSAEASTIYKHFNGLIDDVRVYNYALSDAEIVALASMGELPVSVDAGPNDTHQLKPGETVPTAATITDNGTPGTLNYLWETVARPADSNAIFDDPAAENTEVQFPDFGTYTLRLTVEDVNLGIFVSDEVTLEIVSPTCADVIAEGLLLAGDISGPEGTPDCRVDLYDVAAFAADFLRCVDPQVAECEDPYGG